MGGLSAVGWGSLPSSSPVVIAFGWVGALTAWALFSSPMGTFVKIARDGKVRGFDHLPYVVSVANCGLWVSYGLITPNRLQPLVTNAVGAVLELAYCVVFVRCSPTRKCLRDLVLALSCIAAVDLLAVLGAGEFFPRVGGDAPASSLVGLAAAALNTAMYAAPLNVVRRVVRSKSVEFMPLGLAFGGFFCSATWTVYAIAVGDLAIFIPNICGDVLAIIQFVVYAAYNDADDAVTRRCPCVVAKTRSSSSPRIDAAPLLVGDPPPPDATTV
ncbi:hypothetical protein CTAYLR_003095 [Chrysophaeum taylorii]|uniref:Bidirectional sugar transporter SWEET n=1 Tax=Chrysophaeum taylorii TaxID=2483200 RepID=A0AAD7U6D2_9STRA|nr:hypothetical protein CTAYLR_003095 [Chrysophaeum taylorii]